MEPNKPYVVPWLTGWNNCGVSSENTTAKKKKDITMLATGVYYQEYIDSKNQSYDQTGHAGHA
jgi:hypothetical protein